MTDRVRNIAILGSTGSIGQSTLEVVEAHRDRFRVVALSANSSLELLVQQAQRHHPDWIVAADAIEAAKFDWSQLPQGVQRLTGAEKIEEVASSSEVDIVVAAIVGSAGLRGSWAALQAGKTLALANKETLVVAGLLATKLATDKGATIQGVIDRLGRCGSLSGN